MERLRSYFDTIKLKDIGSTDIEATQAQENTVVEDDNCNDVQKDECENVDAPIETSPKQTDSSSPKGRIVTCLLWLLSLSSTVTQSFVDLFLGFTMPFCSQSEWGSTLIILMFILY